jgi:hypothetical protein
MTTIPGRQSPIRRKSESRLKIVKHALGPQGETVFNSLGNETSESAASVLEAVNAGRNQDAERVKLGNQIADLVGDNVDVAFKLLDDPKVTSLRDIAANYGFSHIASITTNGSLSPSLAVSRTTSSSSTNNVNNTNKFTLRFRQKLFALEPTAVLQQTISADPDQDHNGSLPIHPKPEVRKEISNFLQRNPTFDIRSKSVLEAIHNDQTNLQKLDPAVRTDVVDSLKHLQRVQALTSSPEAIKPLLDQGFTSAFVVSSMPKKQFVSRMTAPLAGTVFNQTQAKRVATSIHDHAMASRLSADNALVGIHQAVRGSGLQVIDGTSNLNDRKRLFNTLISSSTGSPESIDLDAIFGDMDMCECSSCLDVTSPTNYYVDLMQYLRNNDLQSKNSNTSQTGITGTALEKFFIRRPDLQHLQ